MSRPPASRRTALTARKYNRLASPRPASEDLAASCENLVERFRPEWCALGEVCAHLLHVLLPALFDLVLKHQGQRAIPNPLLSLLRVVHHEVGDKRAREPTGLLLGILHHERIDRAERTCHPLPRTPRRPGGRRSRG